MAANSDLLNHNDHDQCPSNDLNKKLSMDGYCSNIFEGKPEQMKQVAEFIIEKGFLPPELIDNEVVWFYK